MSNKTTAQAVVVPGSTVKNNQTSLEVVLVNADGTPAATIKKQAAQADSTASTVAGLVTDFNALLAKLRAAGVIAP